MSADVRVRNLVARTHRHLDRLWRDAPLLVVDPDAADATRAAIAATVDEVHASLDDADSDVGALGLPSRQALATLALLLDPGELGRACRALSAIRRNLREGPVTPDTVTVHLMSMRGLWRRRTRRGHSSLSCHVAFIGVDDERNPWPALARSAFAKSPDTADSQHVRRAAESTAFVERLHRLAVLRGDDGASGAVHDIEASFQRVNARHFGGVMSRPRVLRWSARPTRRKMGHYDFVRDEIMLSRTLDDDRVPVWVVDFVMFHELLHKIHGRVERNGRRLAHTAEFRRDERSFPRYEEAEAFLARLGAELD